MAYKDQRQYPDQEDRSIQDRFLQPPEEGELAAQSESSEKQLLHPVPQAVSHALFSTFGIARLTFLSAIFFAYDLFNRNTSLHRASTSENIGNLSSQSSGESVTRHHLTKSAYPSKFKTNINPRVFLLLPQHQQHRFSPLLTL